MAPAPAPAPEKRPGDYSVFASKADMTVSHVNNEIKARMQN